MANSLKHIYPGATKKFGIILKINGVAQDITSDTVTFRMKEEHSDTDAQAVLTKTADVASQGASGIALFVLTASDTENLEVRNYLCDIVWNDGTDEYVAFDGTIEVKERVSDA